ARLQQEKESLSGAEQTASQIQTLQGQAEAVLANDVSWSRMLQEIARTIPNDTWLTAFQGTSTSGTSGSSGSSGSGSFPGSAGSSTSGSSSSGSSSSGSSETTSTTSSSEGQTGSSTTTSSPAGTPSTGSTATGTVSFTVVGLDFPSVSAWIQRIGGQIPSF